MTKFLYSSSVQFFLVWLIACSWGLEKYALLSRDFDNLGKFRMLECISLDCTVLPLLYNC